ncbi:MAG: sulfurtransferase [Burkholderiales bacterium]|jgi:thiosulfate/3-mercaptopyruvate sulfurtransferase|nr:sulfurtransferase [Burkholderiales bacterium]
MERQYFSTLITPQTLACHLDDPNWLIFDVRADLSEPDWGQSVYRASHIPGAIWLSLDRDLSAQSTGVNGRHPLPLPESFSQRMAQLGLSPERQVVVYDQAQGAFAARLWWMLRWIGFSVCAVLDGGFARWQKEKLPTEKIIHTSRAGKFVANPHNEMYVDADEVLGKLETSTMTLIDARSASRFRGENETIDPVGGHIPGARNRPYTDNLMPDDTFKSAKELRKEFETLLDGASLATVVHQCGSGVTACHNALAMAVAGMPAMRLYAGSWSEWCTNPKRPVAQSQSA